MPHVGEELEIGLLGSGCPVAVNLDFADIRDVVGTAHLEDPRRDMLSERVGRMREAVVHDEDGWDDFEIGGYGVGEGDGGIGQCPTLLIADDIEKADIEAADVVVADEVALLLGELEGGGPVVGAVSGVLRGLGLASHEEEGNEEVFEGLGHGVYN